MNQTELHTLGIDIGSTTVKIAVLDSNNDVLFSDYERHFANIQETLSDLLGRAIYKLGQIKVSPMITGSSWAAKMPRSSILKMEILSSV